MKSFDEFKNNFAVTPQCRNWVALEKTIKKSPSPQGEAYLRAELIWSILEAYHEQFVQRDYIDVPEEDPGQDR